MNDVSRALLCLFGASCLLVAGQASAMKPRPMESHAEAAGGPWGGFIRAHGSSNVRGDSLATAYTAGLKRLKARHSGPALAAHTSLLRAKLFLQAELPAGRERESVAGALHDDLLRTTSAAAERGRAERRDPRTAAGTPLSRAAQAWNMEPVDTHNLMTDGAAVLGQLGRMAFQGTGLSLKNEIASIPGFHTTVRIVRAGLTRILEAPIGSPEEIDSATVRAKLQRWGYPVYYVGPERTGNGAPGGPFGWVAHTGPRVTASEVSPAATWDRWPFKDD